MLKLSKIFALGFALTLLHGCSDEEPSKDVSCSLSVHEYNLTNFVGRTEYMFQNGVISSVATDFVKDDQRFVATGEFDYDSQGRLILIKTDEENYVELEYDGLSMTVRSFRANPEFNTTEVYVLNEIGQIIELTGLRRYEYNRSNQLSKVYRTSRTPEYLEQEYFYDDKNNPFENIPLINTFINPSFSDRYFMFGYSFLNAGANNVIRRVHYDENGEILVEATWEYEYSELGYPIRNGEFGEFIYECEE